MSDELVQTGTDVPRFNVKSEAIKSCCNSEAIAALAHAFELVAENGSQELLEELEARVKARWEAVYGEVPTENFKLSSFSVFILQPMKYCPPLEDRPDHTFCLFVCYFVPRPKAAHDFCMLDLELDPETKRFIKISDTVPGPEGDSRDKHIGH